MKKILYLTIRPPFPPHSGEKIRSYNMLKFLSCHYEVTLITFYSSYKEAQELKSCKGIYKKLILVKHSSVLAKCFSLINLFLGKPLQVGYFFSFRMKNAVKHEMSENYNIVFCHLIRMAQYLNFKKGNNIIDFTDAISMSVKRSIKIQKGIWKLIYGLDFILLNIYERKILKKASHSLFISETDVNFYKKKYKNVHVIPNGVNFYKNEFISGGTFNIMFLGCMRTFPNRDAVKYFVSDIFPLILEKVPKAKFYIVGSEPAPEILDLANENIVVTGYVENMKEYFEISTVFVAPMRTGAGVQNKILESLSVGLPVITTSIGAEGLDPEFLVIADNPDYFAEKVVLLLSNKSEWSEFSVRSKNYIFDNFSWNKQLNPLKDII